jgi:hypothetical protein
VAAGAVASEAILAFLVGVDFTHEAVIVAVSGDAAEVTGLTDRKKLVSTQG